MATKDWEQTDIETSPPSDTVFENGKGKIIWIRQSEAYNGQWVVGGLNKRGYMSNKYFKSKSSALQYAKNYMRTH